MTTLRNGRYELVRTLGEGTQAETWEALDTGSKASLGNAWEGYIAAAKTGKTAGKARAPDPRGLVAIKCFRVGKAKSWKDVELAEREARILKELNHAHLPRYIEHFEEEGALYLVMEKIEGESLATIRARGGGASVADVQRMLTDIGEALRYLHGRAPAIVHRDIKPGNILRRPDGSYALVDFGAVRDRLKPSGGSTVVGTFGFMAPEQFQGRASPRSDLYGLAATALVMLTGEEPEDLPHQGLGIDVDRAVPRGTPRPLVRTLAAMLEPDPDQRTGTIHAALSLLKASAPPPPATRKAKTAPPTPPVTTPRNRKERRIQKVRDRELRRSERRVARARRRERRAPLVPRVIGRLALLLAWLAVWISVGVAVPVVLFLLSLVFGKRLRLAAEACFRAEKRAKSSIGRASRRLSGHLPEEAHVRVDGGAEEARAVRVGDEEEGDADTWFEERLEGEDDPRAQRERMRDHAQRKHWGR